MKKILSLALAALMVVSAVPTAFAAEIPEVGTTTVTLVGTAETSGSTYEVTVPAKMAPGDTADVVIEGSWKSTETLKVTAPEKVTLHYGDQSMDVGVEFAGINQIGNDKDIINTSCSVKLEDKTATFGIWTGVIEYEVKLVEFISFTIDGVEYQAIEDMTWGEWVESKYNTTSAVFNGNAPGMDYGSIYNSEKQGYTLMSKDSHTQFSNQVIVADAAYHWESM